jgi:alginate O-acetyltransferase complex protein AlgI
MSFASLAFALLLALVLVLRVTVGRTKQEPAYLLGLLLASLLFYGWHVPAYLVLLVGSTTVDFVAARLMSRPGISCERRRVCLVVSVVVNLGLLGFFKYANFFATEAVRLLGVLGVPGVAASTVDVVLPIGISFYTFQSMSYSIDVYRGIQRPEPVFWRFLLFVSFFPQLVAGPIVRSRDFLYQIGRRRRLRFPVVSEGVYLVVRGFFLKLVLADNIGFIVDERWDAAVAGAGGSGFSLAIAWLFSCQIFCDFAGYSSIARGVAYLLGFRLPVNFDAPYLAGSFSGFWRRWHITLSTWLRDYLYVSLGGNRGTRARTFVNLSLVMLLGGLWHGASNHFIVWGAIHGVALGIERAAGLRHVDRRGALWVGAVWFVVVQATVLAAWVFFRAETVGDAVRFLGVIAAVDGARIDPVVVSTLLVYTLPVVVLHLRTWAGERLGWIAGAHEKVVLAAVMLYATLVGYGRGTAFIYFQF